MLNIEDTDWRQLNTPYGPASDIPMWLKGLSSYDPIVRKESFESLTVHIYHQGSIYDVTAHVVPYLIQFLGQRNYQEKANILGLIYLIKTGRPVVTDNDVSLRSSYEVDGIDFDQAVKLAGNAFQETQLAIYEGVVVYTQLLEDDESNVRMEAARLLSLLADSNAIILPKLQNRIDVESDNNVKSMLIYAMGEILLHLTNRDYVDKYNSVIVDTFNNTKDMNIRLSAALYLIKLKPDLFIEDAVSFLTDAINRPEQHYYLPWGDDFVWSACDALCYLDDMHRVISFEKVLSFCTDPDIAHIITITSLNCLFRGINTRDWDFAISYKNNAGNRKKREYTPNYEPKSVYFLSPEQKNILQAIHNSNAFWQIDNNLLEAYGLPASREALHSMIS